MSDPVWAGDLADFLAEAWRRLEAAEGAARHPALATSGDAGPELRTVVLRSADRSTATLEIHTDAASPKVAQLRRRARASLLVWDPAAALQIRIDARISIRSGASAGAWWDRVPRKVRQRYGGTAPGAPVAAPEDVVDAADPGRFAVLRAYADRIDLLHLGAERQRRAVYLSADGFAGCWVAP